MNILTRITIITALIILIFVFLHENTFARAGGNLGTIIVRDNINKEGQSQPCAYVYRENEKKLVFTTITGGGLYLDIYMIDRNKTSFKGILTDPEFKTSEPIFGKIEKQKNGDLWMEITTRQNYVATIIFPADYWNRMFDNPKEILQ
jgi:hypothetical protein